MKNPHAVALGSLGGRIGGVRRAAALSPERRREISSFAASVRWSNNEWRKRQQQKKGTKMMSTQALRIVQRYHPDVEEVVDATRGVSIHVTAADCKAGSMKNPSACAMARAFGRSYDGAIISLSSAYLIRGTQAVRYRVPDYVSRELVSFDRNNRFEPGTYALLPVSPSHALGYDNQSRSKRKKNPKPRHRAHRTTGVRSL